MRLTWYQCWIPTAVLLSTSSLCGAQRSVLRDEFREEPANVQSSVGELALFSCKPPWGDPEPHIRWKKNGELLPLIITSLSEVSDGGRRISTLNDGSLQIRDLRREDEGFYVCSAQSVAGVRDSRPAQLSVYEKPRILLGPVDVNVQENFDVVFQCTSVGYPEPVTTWKKERGSLPHQRVKIFDNKSLRIKKVKSNDEGTYICRVENRFGWQEAEARLSVHVQPKVISAPRARSVGIGRRVTFECEAIGTPMPTIKKKKVPTATLR